MMGDMTAFFTAMLSAIAAFLAAEPIIYLFGLICLVLVIKAVKNIIS